MTYNDAYIRYALLRELAAYKLPTDLTTRRLLLSAYYRREVIETERFKADIFADTAASEEEKTAAVSARLHEDAAIDDRRFSADEFAAIVSVVTDLGEDVATVTGAKISADAWLETLAAELVDY